MALEGTLKDFSLADILQLIGIQKKTGILKLEKEDSTVRISFINGMVVGAEHEAEKMENKLGSVLVKTGIISQEELDKSLKLQSESLKRLGQVLIEEGFIKKSDLTEALQNQVLQIIYRLFRWKDGNYYFTPENYIDYDKENVDPVSTESILMEGLRMLDEWPLIERKIDSPEIVYRRTEKGKSVKSKIKATVEEDIFEDESTVSISYENDYVLQLIDGTSSVEEIVSRSKFIEFDTYRALFDLLEDELIEKSQFKTLDMDEYDSFRKERDSTQKHYFLIVASLIILVLFALSFVSPVNALMPPVMYLDNNYPEVKKNEFEKLNRIKSLEIRRMVQTDFSTEPTAVEKTKNGCTVLKGKYDIQLPFSYKLKQTQNEIPAEAPVEQ